MYKLAFIRTIAITGFFIVAVQTTFSQNSTIKFKKHVITTDFISEGVAVGDVNRDGNLDIMAGTYWFEAPHWKRQEIDSSRTFDPDKEYSDSFLNFSMDVNLDGWVDLIVFDFPGTSVVWYENPKNSKSHWKKHLIFEKAGNESPAFHDVDGDGREDLVFSDLDRKQMVWFKSPSSSQDISWKRYDISTVNAPGTNQYSHGLGVGDINGDGRPDVMIKDGWWEAPENPKEPNWKFHETRISDSCSQMYVLDINQDGKNDIISASAHLSGVWWQEQKLTDQGKIAFEQHVISYAFAESHSVVLADIDNDGHQDIITGKRSLKRSTWRKNPGTHGPPVLYWYQYTPKEPYWIAHKIDDQSGSGLNLVATDMNKDGLVDLIISNFKGVFFFENVKMQD